MTGSIESEIIDLKGKRRALILAHNYQLPEVQEIADFVGDSLELARKAAATEEEVIVFCGVHFMAETAAILSPQKVVLLPDLAAGCPLADMASVADVEKMRADHPGAKVVCYVNSSAEVKAVSDLCCTSANAVAIVASTEGEVIFLPDQHLGSFAAARTGKKVHLWPGYCPTHLRILPYDVELARKEYPGCLVMVHPECRVEVRDLADEVLSTGQMVRCARERNVEVFAVGTEVGLLHRLRKENPAKTFVPLTEAAYCPDMKRCTLEKILKSLETLSPKITVPEPTRIRALQALQPLLAPVATPPSP